MIALTFILFKPKLSCLLPPFLIIVVLEMSAHSFQDISLSGSFDTPINAIGTDSAINANGIVRNFGESRLIKLRQMCRTVIKN